MSTATLGGFLQNLKHAMAAESLAERSDGATVPKGVYTVFFKIRYLDADGKEQLTQGTRQNVKVPEDMICSLREFPPTSWWLGSAQMDSVRHADCRLLPRRGFARSRRTL